MKQYILKISIIVAALTISYVAMAQNNDEEVYVKRSKRVNTKFYPSRIICYYPFAAISGNFKVGIERVLSEKTSLKANVRIGYGDESRVYNYNPSNYLTSSYSYSVNGSNIRNYFMTMLEVQYRYYFADKAPQGFYTGVYGYYKSCLFDYYHSQYNYSNVYPYTSSYTNTLKTDNNVMGGGLGILIGVQAVTKNKIGVDMYMGSGLSFSTSNGKYLESMGGINDRYLNGINFILGMNVGLGLK